ncbi:type I restriction enzyme HsdR N-terminal domain-containing protein [Microbulbifer sp. CnH-101-E]|uniref:type I restriction enzyme HsdR N-terminal domain-containing protein n=1 Tax=unclassified Microbulbifer TaxID=2619833 RepID=UPI004039992F
MEEKYHSKLEKSFAEYLVTLGYPKDSIVYEPAFLATDGKRAYRPDFAIVDPVKKERLAIIEIKGRHLKDTENTYRQLTAYSKAIEKERIPLFLVTESDSQQSLFPFDLYVFSEEGALIKSDFALFPTFPALTADESAERKIGIRKEKTETIESFQTVSWSLAGVLLSVVVADFIFAQYDMELLTMERMALLGACVALVVIPFAQKFKGLGIEWEKAKNEQDRS